MITLYKGKATCTADPDQLAIMLDAGWTKDRAKQTEAPKPASATGGAATTTKPAAAKTTAK